MITVHVFKTCERVKVQVKVFLTLLNLMVRFMRRPPYPRGIIPHCPLNKKLDGPEMCKEAFENGKKFRPFRQ